MKVLLCDLITIIPEFDRPLGVAQAAWEHAGQKSAGVRTMLRIRGTVGDLPVDLTLELDDGDWAKLGAHLQASPAASEPLAAPVKQTDDLWQSAQDLLRKAGQLSGLELLDQLEGLAGDAASGKRLLVRLRHSAKVKVASGGDTPLYTWVE
ncbi:hypothetical protein ALQ18_05126 [Pseudomonas marginalis pv. marginalis]|nr:hypothetical protein ALQ18_05126 [Pseudomonas marginalis pv. marginalis]